MAPNFFVAVKGPDGSAAVAKRQVCYDGALGARGIHSLQSYGSHKSVYGNAYTISSMYHDGTLKMYTSHLAEPKNPEGRPEYHMSQINTWGMTGNADTFRQGARAYRNARDWAKEQRDDANRQTNEIADVGTEAPTGHAGGSPALSFVTAVSDSEAYIMSQESRTSLDEDSNIQNDIQESDNSIEEFVDYRLPAKRLSRRAKHSQVQRKRRNADISDDVEHSDGSAVIPDSQNCD